MIEFICTCTHTYMNILWSCTSQILCGNVSWQWAFISVSFCFFSSEGGGWMRCPTNDMRIVRSFPRESAISGLKKWCILTCVV